MFFIKLIRKTIGHYLVLVVNAVCKIELQMRPLRLRSPITFVFNQEALGCFVSP